MIDEALVMAEARIESLLSQYHNHKTNEGNTKNSVNSHLRSLPIGTATPQRTSKLQLHDGPFHYRAK